MTRLRDLITSRGNPLLKQLRRAAARGTPTANGCALAESPHLLTEAVRSGIEIERVFVSERVQANVAASIPPHLPIPLHPVADRLFAELSTTSRSQGVLALVKLPVWEPDAVFAGLTLALDGVQEPGNAGTIARSAEAFGASGIVFLKGSAAPTNPKALRAAAGSLFRLPFLTGTGAETLLGMSKERSKTIFAAEARGGVPLIDAELSPNSTVIIGSETHGVAPILLAEAIPLEIATKGVESLNASVAASVILYEHARRRMRT